MSKAVIYACSHRRGGNSDHAATLLAQGVAEAGGEAEVLYVRDYDIMPCLACGFCDKAVGKEGAERCVLGQKDQAWELFQPLFTSPCVFFASPIYFYHLPSMFKTWIDRGQMLWRARLDNEPWVAELPRRMAHTVLVAGQPTGEKLFEGSRLTIKYFVQNFNIDMASPLTFRGVDAKSDLADKDEFERRIIEMAKDAWADSV